MITLDTHAYVNAFDTRRFNRLMELKNSNNSRIYNMYNNNSIDHRDKKI